MQLTDEQRKIVDAPVSDLLVSAAAGSGKTAVMTERIVQRIVDRKLDASQVLVMTFTDAAAQQMKAKIELKLAAQRLAAVEPELRLYLSSQQTLLAGAAISTIHAFCLTVVKNFSHLATDSQGLPIVEPGFSTADASQADLLLQEALDEVLQTRYLAIDHLPPDERLWTDDFIKLVNSFSNSRSDQPLRGQINKFFTYLRSLPNYLQQIEEYRSQIAGAAADFPATQHAAVLLAQLKVLLNRADQVLPELKRLLDDGLELIKDSGKNSVRRAQLYQLIEAFNNLQSELQTNSADWDRVVELAGQIGDLPMLKVSEKSREDLRSFVRLLRQNVAEAVYCLTGQWGTKVYQAHFLSDTKCLFRQNSQEIEREIAAMQPVLDQLFDLIGQLDAAYRQKKSRLGLIDFSDFEHLALQILKTEEAAHYYRNRYREIYLDEYQDTSSIQAAILQQIGQNNIFMVGDIKQSIYRFRHARPQLFMSRAALYLETAPHQFKTLNRNFRSVPGVLRAVNEIFSQLMTPGAGELNYDDTHALKESRAALDNLPPVHLWLLQDQDSNTVQAEDEETDENAGFETTGSQVDDAAEDSFGAQEEADANPVRSSLDGDAQLPDLGDLTPYQREAQGVRTEIARLLASGCHARDIVILARTKKLVRVFAQTLADASIDTLEETGQRLFDSPELRLLVALLQVMDNPLQDVPLAAVLRSGLFEGGFSPSDLLKIRIAARQPGDARAASAELKFYYQAVAWYGENGPDRALRDRLQRFNTWLELWREKERTLKLGEWLNLLLENSGYFSQVAALPAGHDRLREVRALIDWTYAFERTRQRGLFDLVRYIEKLIQSGLAESPFPLEISQRDAVRVMTIHRSKGLEFPVVFVVGLTAKITPKDKSDALLISENLGIGFDWIDPERHQRRMTHLKLAMLAEQKAAGLAEELRLLYVAMTRAKDQLYLTAMLPKKMPEVWKERLAQINTCAEASLPPEWVLNGSSYLEWLLMALVRHPDCDLSALDWLQEPGYRLIKPTTDVWQIKTVNLQDLLRNPIGSAAERDQAAGLNGKISATTGTQALTGDSSLSAEHLCRLFSANPSLPQVLIDAAHTRISGSYAYPDAAKRPIKVSVSELKRLEQQESRLGDEQTLSVPSVADASSKIQGINLILRPVYSPLQPDLDVSPPEDSSENQQNIQPDALLTGADLGTALHTYMRYLDLAKAHTHTVSTVHTPTPGEQDLHEDLLSQLMALTQLGTLTELESRSIRPYLGRIAEFVRSDLAGRMVVAEQNSQHLYREMPFTLAVSAQSIWPEATGFASDDQVLVQGIIDGWFIENQQAILFDYKSDRIRGDGPAIRAELLRRYARQLSFYARAITQATRLPVAENCLVHLISGQILTYSAAEINAALERTSEYNLQDSYL